MARFEMSGAETAFMAEIAPSVESLFELGICYATGREGATDLVAAHKWFNLAAMRGEMSPRDIAEAQRAAREWLSKH